MTANLPPWLTVYNYSTKWTADGTWARVSGCLTIEAREREKSARPTVAVLDSQSVKNTATNTARVGYDAGKRTKGRRRFFLVDTAGNLMACWVVAAACHDGTSTDRLWDALALGNELLDRLRTVFVDGGFDRCFRLHLARRGVQAQVPRGVLADKGRFFIHAKRWVVERSTACAGATAT